MFLALPLAKEAGGGEKQRKNSLFFSNCMGLGEAVISEWGSLKKGREGNAFLPLHKADLQTGNK